MGCYISSDKVVCSESSDKIVYVLSCHFNPAHSKKL